MSRGPATDDASRGRSPDRTRLRVSDRNSGTVSLRKQIASYLGLVPSEDSSGERRRLGHISKQGTLCCGSRWWTPRKSRRAPTRNGAAGFFTWRCAFVW
jgi:transposase